jgi:5-methyltetrahydropteroyltriglutamate--homocysteine methyltransferase
MRTATDVLLPLTMVGSYPRPRWYKRELHGLDFREAWDFAIGAFNRMVEGIGSSMQIWQHYCWGNPAGQLALGFVPSYRPMLERVFECRFDVLNVEVFHDQGAEIDLLAQVPKDRGVALGLINHRSTVVERPEDLAELVRKALKYVEPDRLYLTTGCGLMHQPRQNAFFKLKALADAARQVRAELTGETEPRREQVAAV